ncbi:acetyl-CoA carboxylase, biotin carboxylase subunit [Streptococcus downei F0415]|nr:acetyl-CoA carboxylase, biotin carboxylase subunit [Streptococcus downei F0415]
MTERQNMFKKILIANRGEIAVRIIRAARELGVETVAIYSEADKESLHVLLADEAICVGPARSSDSYLNMNAVLSAAIVTGAEAIHPGFGFLSENSKFATMCEEMKIKFIGPSGAIMDKMGDKINARSEMIKAQVPVIPGSDGEVMTAEDALKVADEIGYPVMLKASAGGGGKGIRKVEKAEDLVPAFESASQEALAAFGNGAMYIEKVIYPARHIEVQILGDSHGNVIHLGERDCSLQRNNQKVLEESPSIAIGASLRSKMGDAAVRAAKAVGYENAGTIEFLLDETSGNFYFMEMNTRIQVEHPVTEFVTNVDLVKEQIKVANGQELSYSQDDIQITGHAIECRINAENPKFNFAPSPGKITDLYLPAGGVGLRVDSAVYHGYTIPPYYDSMIAKIIVHGENRFDALMKMQRALYELEIDGVLTNADFQLDLISDQNVIAGDYDTSFLMEKFLPAYNQED